MLVDPEKFKSYISQASFAVNGDGYERKYGHLFAQSFPACERFWQQFVVPFTIRVDGYPHHLNGFEQASKATRNNINSDIQDIANAHYTVFHHLLYARAHLAQTEEKPYALSDFYTHLASACDLAETLLEKWYVLHQRSRQQAVAVFQPQQRQDFLQWAGDWYDSNYQEAYEHYLSKGKYFRPKIPGRKSLLDEYLGLSEIWKNYQGCSGLIKQFRNILVHNLIVGKYYINGRIFIPKPEHRQDLRSLDKLFSLTSREQREHLAPASDIMYDDLQKLEHALNQLWEQHLIPEFLEDFYSPSNTTVRSMYDIEFSHEMNFS